MNLPEFISRHIIRIVFSPSVVILLVLHASGAFSLGFINRLGNFSYDVCQNPPDAGWHGVLTFQTR